jgi:outer membrane protein TolC
MRRLFGFAVISMAAALSPSGPLLAEEAASTPPARSAELRSLIAQAMRDSPALAAKRRAYEAARGRVIAAWLPDDPEFGVDAEGQPELFDVGSRMNTEYMVSQRVPFPTTLILRGQEALREAQIALQHYREEERQIIWHLEEPYYTLYLAKKTRSALEEVKNLLETLAETARRRYEANQASLQDVLKAQIERSKIDIELYRISQDEHLAEAHLSHILNLPLLTSYALPAESPSAPLRWTREQLDDAAVRLRPELRAAALGIRQAKTQRLLAVTRWLPEITGRIEAREFRDGRASERDTFIGVTVPVWSLLKGAGGEWQSAARDVEAAEAAYEALRNEVLLAAHDAHAKTLSAEHAVGVYEQFTLPQARQQVELALAAYESGGAEFLELIDAQRMLQEALISYYKFQAERELGLASLRLAIGAELPPEALGQPDGGT